MLARQPGCLRLQLSLHGNDNLLFLRFKFPFVSFEAFVVLVNLLCHQLILPVVRLIYFFSLQMRCMHLLSLLEDLLLSSVQLVLQ